MRVLLSAGLLGALVAAGCATAPSGTIAGVKVPADSTVVIFSTPYYPYDGIDLDGSFIGVLRKYGLSPTNRAGAPFVVRIGFKQIPGSPVVCTLVLEQAGKPVISASGISSPHAATDLDTSIGRDRETADRASAFRAAARDFEAKARGAS